MNIQLEKEMYINSRSRDESRMTIRCCGNCGELGYNICIYKKNKEIFNIYSFK